MVERHPPDAAEAPVHSPELLFVFQLSGLFEVGILMAVGKTESLPKSGPKLSAYKGANPYQSL